MLIPASLSDPNLASGFRHVGFDRNPRASKPYHAQAYGGTNDKAGHAWQGPARATGLEAAQDYCDWYNGLPPSQRPTRRKLRTAGHKGQRARLIPNDPEVAAALGVQRDARGQRQGRQGYVYLIVEGDARAPMFGKIGFSTNPRARVAELQTGNPRKLRLYAYKPGTEADEAALHVKYAHRNLLQEWFHLDRAVLSEWQPKHRVKETTA